MWRIRAGRPFPLRTPAIITSTLDEDELKAAGGPVAFLLARMEHEASSIRYAQALYRWKQGDLIG